MSFRLSRTYIIVEWWRTTASVSFRLSRTYIIVEWSASELRLYL